MSRYCTLCALHLVLQGVLQARVLLCVLNSVSMTQDRFLINDDVSLPGSKAENSLQSRQWIRDKQTCKRTNRLEPERPLVRQIKYNYANTDNRNKSYKETYSDIHRSIQNGIKKETWVKVNLDWEHFQTGWTVNKKHTSDRTDEKR